MVPTIQELVSFLFKTEAHRKVVWITIPPSITLLHLRQQERRVLMTSGGPWSHPVVLYRHILQNHALLVSLRCLFFVQPYYSWVSASIWLAFLAIFPYQD